MNKCFRKKENLGTVLGRYLAQGFNARELATWGEPHAAWLRRPAHRSLAHGPRWLGRPRPERYRVCACGGHRSPHGRGCTAPASDRMAPVLRVRRREQEEGVGSAPGKAW
jgi:hypothetical protein